MFALMFALHLRQAFCPFVITLSGNSVEIPYTARDVCQNELRWHTRYNSLGRKLVGQVQEPERRCARKHVHDHVNQPDKHGTAQAKQSHEQDHVNPLHQKDLLDHQKVVVELKQSERHIDHAETGRKQQLEPEAQHNLPDDVYMNEYA